MHEIIQQAWVQLCFYWSLILTKRQINGHFHTLNAKKKQQQKNVHKIQLRSLKIGRFTQNIEQTKTFHTAPPKVKQLKEMLQLLNIGRFWDNSFNTLE